MLIEKLPEIQNLGANAPSRLCPILAGPAMIDGDQLVVRLADGDISISASRTLLRKIFALCDGTRSIDELMETIHDVEERDRIRRFIDFLLESGALIDACYYSFTATSFALGNSPFGQPAEGERSIEIGRRFSVDQNLSSQGNIHRVSQAPLEKQFAERVSTYIFNDRPIALADLNTMLWSMSGIVHETREHFGYPMPRRTIPSAGSMHLVDLYVAIQRTVTSADGESLAPGIYRVHFPGEYMVQYEKVGSDISLLPRTLAKPWCLDSSTGVIFLAANARLAGLRYRNRSIQYLFTEAGMALQNGALTAPELGLGFVSFGSYYEAIVKQICSLTPDHLILGSAIFGPTPTPEQLNQANVCPRIEFAWADAPSEYFTLPYFVGRVKIKGAQLDYSSWGRDTDPALACRKAVAEAIERQGYQEPRNLQYATFAELDHAIDPRLIARFSDAQYQTADFSCTPFSTDARNLWAIGKEYGSGKEVAILADFIYAASSLRTLYDKKSFYWKSNSSGCAAGTTMADAQLAALLELIERDAFMRHWFMQSPGTGIIPGSLPKALHERVQAIVDAGFDVSVQTLPSQWAQVAFIFARHPTRHVSCVSAGARLSLESAVDSALVELESRVFSLLNGLNITKLKPKEVVTPDDHFGLYAQRQYFKRADRLFSPLEQIEFEVASKQNLQAPQSLFEQMIAGGITPIFVDITPRLNGINNGREQLAATRAFAPGLLPMSFGFGMEPRGMASKIHSASLFPHPFP